MFCFTSWGSPELTHFISLMAGYMLKSPWSRRGVLTAVQAVDLSQHISLAWLRCGTRGWYKTQCQRHFHRDGECGYLHLKTNITADSSETIYSTNVIILAFSDPSWFQKCLPTLCCSYLCVAPTALQDHSENIRKDVSASDSKSETHKCQVSSLKVANHRRVHLH